MTHQEFLKKYGIVVSFKQVDANPHMSDMIEGSRHFEVWTGPAFDPESTDDDPLFLGEDRRYSYDIFAMNSYYVPHFSLGPGIKGDPDPAQWLDCVATDANSVVKDVRSGKQTDTLPCNEFVSFEEWCDDLGYNPDSIKDKETYDVTCMAADGLLSWLGFDAYNELLYEVEDEC